jgi:hypothetical protein
MTSGVVFQALKHVWRSLEPLNPPMAVMGGIAMAYYGHSRGTKDVDLLISLSEVSADALIEQLTKCDVRVPKEDSWKTIGELRLCQTLYEPEGLYIDLQIDLLVANGEYHRRSLDRRVAVELPIAEIKVDLLTCEDLLIHKLLAGRMIDRADAVALLEWNRDRLDFEYLERWIDRRGLTSEWHDIQNSAQP